MQNYNYHTTKGLVSFCAKSRLRASLHARSLLYFFLILPIILFWKSAARFSAAPPPCRRKSQLPTMTRFCGVMLCGMVRRMHVTPTRVKEPTRIRSQANPVLLMPPPSKPTLLPPPLRALLPPLGPLPSVLLLPPLLVHLLPVPVLALLPSPSSQGFKLGTSGGTEWQHGITAKSMFLSTAHRRTSSVRHEHTWHLCHHIGIVHSCQRKTRLLPCSRLDKTLVASQRWWWWGWWGAGVSRSLHGIKAGGIVTYAVIIRSSGW